MNRNFSFWVAVPPGESPLYFYLPDLIRDPDRYAPKLRSSQWASFWATPSAPREILGESVSEDTISVGIRWGYDQNCEGWKSEWARSKEVAHTLSTDQYGWTRQDHVGSPETTTFIKFLDEGDRAKSRYYLLYCGVHCDIRACRNDLTAWIKVNRFPYTPQNFDEQIASGIRILQHLVEDRPIDLSKL